MKKLISLAAFAGISAFYSGCSDYEVTTYLSAGYDETQQKEFVEGGVLFKIPWPNP